MPKVCIDAGHYGNVNKCPNNSNYYESNVMWKLHLLQKKYLEQLGIEVVTTRTNKDIDLSVTERGKKAKGCDLFISDHSNAVGSSMNESVDYVAVYHLTNDINTNCDDISKNFATIIAPVIAKVMGVNQGSRTLTRLSNTDKNKDGVMNDNYYGVLNGSRSVGVAGVILEHSFHTNSKSVKWLLSDTNLDKLAKAEAETIATFLLGKKVTIESNTSKSEASNTNVLYRVQVGSFAVKANAEKRLHKVKECGFTDAFITTVKSGDKLLNRVQVGSFAVKANAEKRLQKLKECGFTDAFITKVKV